MALYAVDEDDLIFAGHAEKGKLYWCLDCHGPVKKRLGKDRLAHFYHVRPSPRCRLHSKTEDHMRAQLQLQKSFPPGALQLERPFIQIDRIADLCWESEKVVFEVQCSPLTEKEVEQRTSDYLSQGYDCIWLLDDKRYNKRMARPAEVYLRRQSAYYISIRSGLASEIYDQFEVFAEERRIQRGRRMRLDLQRIGKRPKPKWDEAKFPKQIVELQWNRYFLGDRIDKALYAQKNAYASLAMQNWRALELQLGKTWKRKGLVKNFLRRFVINPYLALFQRLIRKSCG